MRNVILVIGDGMGFNHLRLARIRRYGLEGRLHLERLPVIGLVDTFAAEGELVTDSAAAATAMATGYKTRIGSVGTDAQETVCENLVGAAAAAGYATGMVTSGALTNATIAGFATHVASRSQKGEIARQLARSSAKLLVGGSEHFRDADRDADRDDDKDGFDVIASARQNGYEVTIGEAAFLAARRLPVLAFIDGMEGDVPPKGIPGAAEGSPRLARSARKALELLSPAAKGFVLLVENDGIDTFSHDHNLDESVRQVLELDDAVEEIVRFAREDSHTLVLVTADHETGGLAIVDPSRVGHGTTTRWSTAEHSGSTVPLYALGPGASAFAGVIDNTDLPRRIGRLLHLDGFPGPCVGSLPPDHG